MNRRRIRRSYNQETLVDQNSASDRWLPRHLYHLARNKRARLSLGALVRGVVVAVYEPDDPAAGSSPKAIGLTSKYSSWLCDVEIIEDQYRCVIPRVPVVTQAFGITDMVQWKPRAATMDVREGKTIALESTETSTAPPITECDGDVVIVAFLDNDYNKPVIIGALPHPETKRAISKNDDPKYKWQAVVRGNLVGIQDGGQIDIDATGQTTGTVAAGGTEEASGNATISIKTNGATVTIDDDGIKIEESDGTTVTINDGVDIEVQSAKKVSIGGNSLGGIKEALVKAGAWDDMFDPATGAWWAEAFPIVAAVGIILGQPTTGLAAVLAAFTAGFSTTGATITTQSTESD